MGIGPNFCRSKDLLVRTLGVIVLGMILAGDRCCQTAQAFQVNDSPPLLLPDFDSKFADLSDFPSVVELPFDRRLNRVVTEIRRLIRNGEGRLAAQQITRAWAAYSTDGLVRYGSGFTGYSAELSRLWNSLPIQAKRRELLIQEPLADLHMQIALRESPVNRNSALVNLVCRFPHTNAALRGLKLLALDAVELGNLSKADATMGLLNEQFGAAGGQGIAIVLESAKRDSLPPDTEIGSSEVHAQSADVLLQRRLPSVRCGALTIEVQDRITASGNAKPQPKVRPVGSRLLWVEDSSAPIRQSVLVARHSGRSDIAWTSSDNSSPILEDSFILGPPVGDGDCVYVLLEHNRRVVLAVLNSADGSVRWTKDVFRVNLSIHSDHVRRSMNSGPQIVGGTIVCPSAAGVVVGLDIVTGRFLWSAEYSSRYEHRDQQNWLTLTESKSESGGAIAQFGRLVRGIDKNDRNKNESGQSLQGDQWTKIGTAIVCDPGDAVAPFAVHFRTGRRCLVNLSGEESAEQTTSAAVDSK